MSTAVLLLAHGTPDSPANVPAYLRNITGGRPVPDSVLQEVQHRYSLIGRSPLTDISRRQADALQAALDVPVYLGMRNWHPFIADVVQQMRTDGVTRAVTLCLAPHNSRTSVGLYRKAVETAAQDALSIDFIASWHSEPQLITAFTERLRAARPSEPHAVLFTAHSVPCRTISSTSGAGDPYGEQAKHTAELVARAAGLSATEWAFAFQSQGMTGEPWIGPTVEATLDALAAAGITRVLVQPIGFVCDHVEVLYDIDIAFKQYAAEHGITLTRTESLNDSPAFIAALANVAHSRLAAAVPSK